MATYTNLNLARLANAALEAFVKEMTALAKFSTSFSPEEAGSARGNVVLVPLIGTLTATTFGGSYAICGGTKTVVTVTINRHKIVHIGQTDLTALDSSHSSLESFGGMQGAALAQCVVEDVLTLVTTANFSSVAAVSLANTGVTELRAARLALNQANAPKNMRNCIIDSAGMDVLLAVTNFVQAMMFADNQVLKEGRVTRALGMDFFEQNGSFVAAASVNAFVASPAAIAVAMRYLAPQRPDAYDSAQAYTDPASGMTIGLRDYYDPLSGTRYVALEANYGYVAGITNAGRIIKRLD